MESSICNEKPLQSPPGGLQIHSKQRVSSILEKMVCNAESTSFSPKRIGFVLPAGNFGMEVDSAFSRPGMTAEIIFSFTDVVESRRKAVENRTIDSQRPFDLAAFEGSLMT